MGLWKVYTDKHFYYFAADSISNIEKMWNKSIHGRMKKTIIKIESMGELYADIPTPEPDQDTLGS